MNKIDVIEVIRKRSDYFKGLRHHTFHAKELDKAIAVIEANIPPDYFEVANPSVPVSMPVEICPNCGNRNELTYLKIEYAQQVTRIEKLGINVEGQMFEQCVNALIDKLEQIFTPSGEAEDFEGEGGNGQLFVWNPIETQLDEVQNIAAAKKYYKDYMEDGNIHPDIEGIIVLRQIGHIQVTETEKTTEIDGQESPVCNVKIVIQDEKQCDYPNCNCKPPYKNDMCKTLHETEQKIFGERSLNQPKAEGVIPKILYRIDSMINNGGDADLLSVREYVRKLWADLPKTPPTDPLKAREIAEKAIGIGILIGTARCSSSSKKERIKTYLDTHYPLPDNTDNQEK